MRLASLLLVCAPIAASAQEVARVFGKPVTASELKLDGEASLPAAARALRELVLKDAMPRFVAANNLKATPQEIADYQRWEADFQRVDRKRRAERLAEIERELAHGALDEKKRKSLEEQRGVLVSLAKYDAERPAGDAAASAATNAWWIEIYKVRRALYEKYGGRVGITKFGPDPSGAIEALLREHEKRGELQISDAVLAKEFWAQLAREPRMPATKPEHLDFSYYWLKPVDEARK